MSEVSMSVVADAELLRKAQQTLDKRGIDINTEFNRFLACLVECDKTEQARETPGSPAGPISFDSLPKEEQERILKVINTKGPRSEVGGLLKGLVWMSDDFDDPIEGLEEYM